MYFLCNQIPNWNPAAWNRRAWISNYTARRRCNKVLYQTANGASLEAAYWLEKGWDSIPHVP